MGETGPLPTGDKGAERPTGRTVAVLGAPTPAPGWSNGRACAVESPCAGAAVVCVDVHVDRVEETVALIERDGGVATAVAADSGSDVVDVSAVDRGRDHLLERTPLGRFATPDEIAASILFLASPAAGYVTGTTLFADGGRSAQ